MAGHNNCCKNRKAPKTRAQFAALNYPPNPGHEDVRNRLQNPEKVPVKYKKPEHARTRKGWWFRLKPSNPGPPFLDGSGDGKQRGTIAAATGITPVTPGDRLICLNACNLKELPVPGLGKKLCGFTWNVRLNSEGGISASGSGWMPLSAIEFKNPSVSRPKMMAALRSWACCMEKYEKWGRALTKSTPIPYVLRNVTELEEELVRLKTAKASSERFRRYFREKRRGSVTQVLGKIAGSREKLAASIGILPACKNGNKLHDYLPKGDDFKDGRFLAGYTNLSANIATGATRPTMAPIALDIFPAGHRFYRLPFKDGKPVLGFIYRVRSQNPGVLIGKCVWYYGYCNVKSGEGKLRRYGWVPALAVKRA